MNKRTGNHHCAVGHALAILLCLHSMPVCAEGSRVADADLIVPTDRLDGLALGLGRAPDAMRADLAGIALDELSAAYAQEALLAREEKHRQAPARELQRWADAVDRLATQLATLAATVTSATPVHIGISPEHSLYLVVDGEPVVVNGPRTTQQAALEHRIIERFCRLNPCDSLFAELPRTNPAARTAPAANPHWSFGEGAGPVCSSGDGLDFAFSDSENLLQKRSSCARIIAELYALADTIARYASSGSRIEWNALAIEGPAGEHDHYLRINSDGTTVRLDLPLLAAAPRLLSRVLPWLAARVDGRQQRVVIEDAEQFLPRGLAPQ